MSFYHVIGSVWVKIMMQFEFSCLKIKNNQFKRCVQCFTTRNLFNTYLVFNQRLVNSFFSIVCTHTSGSIQWISGLLINFLVYFYLLLSSYLQFDRIVNCLKSFSNKFKKKKLLWCKYLSFKLFLIKIGLFFISRFFNLTFYFNSKCGPIFIFDSLN